MFYRQLTFFGHGYFFFPGAHASVEDEEEEIQDAEGQAFLDFDLTPSLF